MKKSLDDLIEELRKIHSEFKVISTETIVVSEWVRWKCMFGCKAFGKHLNCPPFVPPVEETRKLLKCYNKAIIFRFEAKPDYSQPPEHIHHFLMKTLRDFYDKMFEIERIAYLFGYYKAFALYALPCPYCDPCVAEMKEIIDYDPKRYCKFSHKVRPAMEAVGIDVFETVRNAGYALEVLTSPTENILFYGLLLLE
ncbi:MAG: hypothetical protein PWQ22_1203 [Archaeoglobaceae archaeon]|nr:hypothetical protein [Archaeoglobaceae archaeon]MDK2876793.1 hypothetical protein [Archaeoglobaceae archaeon]